MKEELMDFSTEELEMEIARRKDKAVDRFEEALREAYNNGLTLNDMKHILDNF